MGYIESSSICLSLSVSLSVSFSGARETDGIDKEQQHLSLSVSICLSVCLLLLGLGTYGLYYAYRAAVVSGFNTEHYSILSRWRYQEKQGLFFKELDEALAAGSMASLVKEYDPVATRLPFKPL